MTATWQSPNDLESAAVEVRRIADGRHGANVHRTDPVQDLVDAIAVAAPPQSLIEIAADALAPLGVIGGALIAVNAAGQPTTMGVAGVSTSIKPRLGAAVIDGGYPAMAALRDEVPYWFTSRYQVARRFPVFAAIHSHWQAYAALPLQADARLVGSVDFPFDHALEFDATTRLTVEAIAALLATGLQRMSPVERDLVTPPFLLDSMVDGALIIDTSLNRVTYANGAAARLMGNVVPDELLMPVADLVNRFELRYVRPPVALEDGRSDAVLTLRNDHGEQRRLRAHVSPVDAQLRRLVVLIDIEASERCIDVADARGVIDALREDRQRVARDLHDGAIQTVFATSLTLAALALETTAPVRARIEHAIDGLDQVVRQLRSAVFDLRHRSTESPVTRIGSTIEQFAQSTGVMPTLHVAGPLDGLADDDAGLVDHLDLALRETLSNVARHAHASAVMVTVRACEHSISFAVHDDGVGFAEGTAQGDGLANLRQRAAELGGRCSWESTPGMGTVVHWSIPRPAPGDAPPPPRRHVEFVRVR